MMKQVKYKVANTARRSSTRLITQQGIPDTLETDRNPFQ